MNDAETRLANFKTHYEISEATESALVAALKHLQTTEESYFNAKTELKTDDPVATEYKKAIEMVNQIISSCPPKINQSFEYLRSLAATVAQQEEDPDPRRKPPGLPWYVRSEEEGPKRAWHTHYCRECFTESECLKDECYWTFEFICHNCDAKRLENLPYI